MKFHSYIAANFVKSNQVYLDVAYDESNLILPFSGTHKLQFILRLKLKDRT